MVNRGWRNADLTQRRGGAENRREMRRFRGFGKFAKAPSLTTFNVNRARISADKPLPLCVPLRLRAIALNFLSARQFEKIVASNRRLGVRRSGGGRLACVRDSLDLGGDEPYSFHGRGLLFGVVLAFPMLPGLPAFFPRPPFMKRLQNADRRPLPCQSTKT